jgi:thiol-disulfide isomerase/thioredoxin
LAKVDRVSAEAPEPEHKEGEQTELRRAARPYSITVGVLFAIAALIAGVNSLSNRSAGPGGLEPNTPLPRFAAPAASGTLKGDANINQDNTDASGDRRTPACRVPGPRTQVIRICDYFDRPLVMVGWFTRGCGTCRRQLDTVELVRKRFPQVAFIGLDIASSRQSAAKDVRKNGWGFPMAVDPDGAVSGLYRIGGGPTTFFAYPGGIAMGTAFGELDEEALVARVQRLLHASTRLGLLP